MKCKLLRQAPFTLQKDSAVSNTAAPLHSVAAIAPAPDRIGDIPPSKPFSIRASITVTSNTWSSGTLSTESAVSAITGSVFSNNAESEKQKSPSTTAPAMRKKPFSNNSCSRLPEKFSYPTRLAAGECAEESPMLVVTNIRR